MGRDECKHRFVYLGQYSMVNRHSRRQPERACWLLFERFWELDALRGVALVFMVAYHFVFDLNYFEILRLGPQSPFFLAAPAIGGAFLLLAGVSLSISYARHKNLGAAALFSRQLRRGALLFAAAALITAATLAYPDRGFVVFGVIHLIAVSVVLSFAFRNFGTANLFLGLALVLAGVAAGSVTVDTPFLVWLGVSFPGFYTLDYYPLLPWFGVVLVGMFLGKTVYPGANRSFRVPAPRLGQLQFLGRNSLAIYLLHQPILVGIITAFKFLAG